MGGGARPGRRGGRGAAFRLPGPERAAPPRADRFAVGAPRAAAHGRDAAAAVARVPGGGRAGPPSGGTPYGYSQFCDLYATFGARSTCRCARCTAPARRSSSTTRARSRGSGRRHDRRGDRGRALRRGAGRVQLHVRGGDAHADGWRTSARRRCARLNSSAACPRSRCPISSAAPSAALIATTPRSTRRTRSWRSTTTWRSCRRGRQAAGQGEGRGGGAGRAALDPGVPPQPHLLQPRRAQRGDRRAAREAERDGPSRSSRAAAARPSRRWTGRRCGRCRRHAGSWRAGRRPR